MKKYTVTTQSSVNKMELHALFVPGIGYHAEQFETYDIVEAVDVYRKEVAALSAQYTKQSHLDYTPSDYELSHGIFCEITSPVFDADGDVVDIESIKTSELFFED